MQGYNDNSGLGPILANYLNQSDPGRILALVINELGDHQMETYFRSTDDSYGGMICRDEPDMDDLFNTMDGIHRKSFEDLGGKYMRHENETTCAIRLPPNRFFEVILVSISRGCADTIGIIENNQSDRFLSVSVPIVVSVNISYQ